MSRPETVELWRQRLQRFDPASMTVAEFCQLEGVSQASFYKWKKKLHEPHGPATFRSTQPEVSFVPLGLSAAAENRVDVASDHVEHKPVAPLLASTTIELPGGVRIRVEVPTGFSSDRSGGDHS